MKLIVSYLTLIRKLRNAEHFDFFTNIIAYIQTKMLKPAALLPLWALLCQLFDKEDAIYKRDLGSVETKPLNEANEKRKMSFMAFKRGVELGAYDETAALREAAATLMEITDKYANAYKTPMTEISALFFNMIQDLAKPRYAAAIATIGLADAVARLERDNEAFKAIYVERTYNLEEIKSLGTMKDIRRQVDEAAVIFTDSINTFYRTNELMHPVDQEVKAVLEDVITFFNSFIHQYETIYSRRNPKYHSGKEETPSLPDGGDEPDEEEPDALPRFEAVSQEIRGTGFVTSTGSQMSVEMDNPAAFSAALYPIAEDGILRLYNPSENNAPVDYTIAGFLTNNDGIATGLLVDASSPNVGFVKPFYGIGACNAEVVKDNQILAFIDGLQFPATMVEG
ncbi:MAG: DUF6261 family protein [Tannerellaceae bacterium]|jgi:hypothetical protein|nr:DUF6261 family protein [Tannerellaceae bacterium]